MTIVEISKQKIINAIKKEPLKDGYWVDKDDRQDHVMIKYQPNCAVCAVGAVMKNILNPTLRFEWISIAANWCVNTREKGTAEPDVFSTLELAIFSTLELAIQQIKDKKYMSGLSLFFELETKKAREKNENYNISRHQIYRIRQKTIQFVKDHFPSKIQIDIDGAKPAKDIKVVG